MDPPLDHLDLVLGALLRALRGVLGVLRGVHQAFQAEVDAQEAVELVIKSIPIPLKPS